MKTDILLHLLDAVLYGLLAAWLWRARRRPTQHAPALWKRYGVGIPWALQGVLLYRSIFAADGMFLGVGHAVAVIFWLTLLIYWMGNQVWRLGALQGLIMPAAAVAALFPVLFPATQPLAHAGMAAFKAHLVLSLLAYSLLTIAAFHVLLITLLERGLHGGAAVPADLPPLLTLETLLFRIIAAGFVLLTLTLASGMLFSEELFGKPWQLTHKTVFGVASWGIFAALLAGRWIRGWRGRVALRWTWAGFLCLVLAYVGSKFVMEVVLGRG